MLAILIGKTCSGKTSIAEALTRRGYKKIVTYTSRPKREHEIHGVDYYFVTQEEFEEKALKVLRSGWYVLGEEVSAFEEEFAKYIGSKYCVGVANGLDALCLAFRV